jgi:hypothetical protein
VRIFLIPFLTLATNLFRLFQPFQWFQKLALSPVEGFHRVAQQLRIQLQLAPVVPIVPPLRSVQDFTPVQRQGSRVQGTANSIGTSKSQQLTEARSPPLSGLGLGLGRELFESPQTRNV